MTQEHEAEKSKLAWTVLGQALEFSSERERIKIRLTGLSDDLESAWIPTPPNLPSWISVGDVFKAQLNSDVTTYGQLANCPWAMQDFPKSAPLPITDEELDELDKWCEGLGL